MSDDRGPVILVIEDDAALAAALRYDLEREGFRCIAAAQGAEGLRLALQERPDLVLLDLMLPGLDGLEVCRRLRAASSVPIIVLTAPADEIDRIVSLEVGADHYVSKPFSMRELLARVRAALRRTAMASVTDAPAVIGFGDVAIDLARREVRRSGSVVPLKPKEFDLLLFLASHAGQVFTRDQLLDRVWGYTVPGYTRTVDVHVRWLREKVEPDPARPVFLLTDRGVGYRFCSGVTRSDHRDALDPHDEAAGSAVD